MAVAGEYGWRKYVWVLIFLGPGLVGLILFTLSPILASLGLTLFQWDLITPPVFVGLRNFQDIFASSDFWQALGHTLSFVVGYIPLVMVFALAIALLLNQRVRGLALFRTAFFIPVVSSWVVISLLGKWIFNPRFGLVNYTLGLFGIQGPTWLFSPQWAMPAIILTSVWKDVGFVMVMFLAGLQAIPADYREASSLDGASDWQHFRTITLPLLSPTTFFALIISLIASFQVFDQVWIMSENATRAATSVLVQQIVQNAFSYGRMGTASALSWVLFVFIFLITLVQLRLQRTWVAYE
ncbi:MAG TPA: sugar ABC transporter permease [Aggregatilineales bacterium]|nr:sugar ABC transporter permease [Aggregatilineales bacterium]